MSLLFFLLCLPVFVAIYIVFLKLITIFSFIVRLTLAVFSFSDSLPTEITENVFTVTESILRKEIFATPLNLGEIVLLWEQIG